MLNAGRQWLVSPHGVKSWTRFMPGLHRRLGRPAPGDIRRVRRLGVLRLDGMGDIVLTAGMLRELRSQMPETRITFICQSSWAPWMRTCPWVDHVVDVQVSPSDEFRETRRIREMLRFVKRVWPLELEMIVHPGTFRSYLPSRALAWLSGAPVRFCWEDPDAGIDTGRAFYTHSLSYPDSVHEAEKCFRMLEAMGLDGNAPRLEKWWTEEDGLRGENIAREARSNRRRLVALGLAASEAGKRWPASHYLKVIRTVSATQDVAFLALGGRDVMDECRWLAASLPGVVTYPGDELPLGQLWSAISHCDLYLGNDTGLMHMAAAAHLPVVVVIGIPEGARPGTRGDAGHTGPYRTVSRVMRPPAGTAADPAGAIALVSPDDVTAAVLEMLP